MRRIWADNLRCIVVLLVVIYHCFYIFNSVGVFGGLGPFNEKQPVDMIEYALYPWFMALLFLLAGMSAKWSLDKRSSKEFFRGRSLKLLVPSTLGLFVLYWIVGYFNAIAGGGIEGLQELPGLVRYLIYAVSGIGPLWFIQLLWLYSLILISIRALDKEGKFNDLVSRAFGTNVAVFIIVLFFGAFCYAGTILTNYEAPLMGLYRIPFYIVPFLFGYFFFSSDAFLERLRAFGPYGLVLFLLMAVLYTLRWYPECYTSSVVQEHWTTVVFASLGSVCLLSAALRYLDRPIPFLSSFLVPRSYGIYLLHYLPLVVFAYYMKQFTDLSPEQIYPILLVSVPIVSIALYDVLRHIPVVRWLVLGMKNSSK